MICFEKGTFHRLLTPCVLLSQVFYEIHFIELSLL